MKKIFLFICFAFISLASCTTENDIYSSEDKFESKEIYAEWNVDALELKGTLYYNTDVIIKNLNQDDSKVSLSVINDDSEIIYNHIYDKSECVIDMHNDSYIGNNDFLKVGIVKVQNGFIGFIH